jgi:uncharacterized protein (TIGR00297 family)
VRDFKQVLANGGIGIFLVVLNYFFYSDNTYLSYIGLLSVVCADTWSTEIGTLLPVQTYNVLTLKKVSQGESGGISLLGYAGSVLGSVIIALSASYWLKWNLNQFFPIVIFTGLFGNIIDSILGALIQAQYKCSICGLITEKKVHCNSKTMIIRGKKWFDNDLVNVISGFSGCIIILVFQNLSNIK